MKEQMLLTGDSRYEWSKQVNDYLRKGWVVVPGTLSTHIAVTSVSNGSQSYSTLEKSVVCAIVLEKQDIPGFPE